MPGQMRGSTLIGSLHSRLLCSFKWQLLHIKELKLPPEIHCRALRWYFTVAKAVLFSKPANRTYVLRVRVISVAFNRSNTADTTDTLQNRPKSTEPIGNRYEALHSSVFTISTVWSWPAFTVINLPKNSSHAFIRESFRIGPCAISVLRIDRTQPISEV